MREVVILGAGAIGSLYGALLSRRYPVILIGRAPHVKSISDRGLVLSGLESATVRVRASITLDAVGPDTLIILATKVGNSEAAAASVRDLVRPDTIILCLQNGLDGDRIVREVIGERCLVLRGITNCGAIFREPGAIEWKAVGPTLIEDGPRSAIIIDMLRSCGLEARLTDTMRVEVWRKLIFNCVINPITALLGSEVGAIADVRLDPLKRLVIEECVAVASSEGVHFDLDFLSAIVETFGSSTNTASMLQDLRQGKPTEIDYINGAVVRLAEQAGLDCPVNRSLVLIIKELGRASARSQ